MLQQAGILDLKLQIYNLLMKDNFKPTNDFIR